MIGSKIHYTPQSFYTENQAKMPHCLQDTTGCVDLNRASPVKQIFDKILADRADKHDYGAFPNPDLVTYYDSKNEIKCDANKGNSFDYVNCRGRIDDNPKVSYFYYLSEVSRLQQGAVSVWHEALIRIGKDWSESKENRFLGNDTSKLGYEFANAVIYGPEELGRNPLTIVALTVLATVTLYGIYKVASRYLNKEKKFID